MSGLLSYTVESQYTVQWCNKGPHRPHCAGILAGPVRDQDVIYIYTYSSTKQHNICTIRTQCGI